MDRRQFVRLAGALGLGVLCRPLAAFAAGRRELDAALVALLEKSPLVYISPLLASGAESTCHGEVWYAWLDGAVVATVSTEGWRARALVGGLDGARIWVGDHGPWKRKGTRNEAFRSAPSFRARAERSRDGDLNEALLAAYARKYPAEIDRWRDRMRAGFEDGSRTLLRYEPVAEEAG